MTKKKKSKKGKVIPMRRKLSPKNYIKKVARKLPIYEVQISEGYQESGFSNIIVTRSKANGQLVVGAYLIDSFCLGLTDTHYYIIDPQEYENLIVGMNELEGLELIEIEPNLAFNYIYGSIEYADDNGFEPHKDFHITKYILDDIDSMEYMDIEFGKNGKPLYVMSEDLNNEKNLNILNKALGPGNYEIESDEFSIDDFEDLESDMTIEELVKQILSEEEELKFRTYLSGMILIDTLYQGAEDKLKNSYLYNQREIINKCHTKLGDVEKLAAADEEDFLQFWMPLVENYLIHGEYEFLYEPFCIKSFQSFEEEDTDLGLFLMNVLLNTYGPNKFEPVLRILAMELFTEEPKQDLIKELRMLIDTPPDELIQAHQYDEFELSTFLIFNYIHLYEQEFGQISLDDMDFSHSDSN